MLSEEKAEILARVEMVEMDKKKMVERLYNLQEANLLKAQQAQVTHCTEPSYSVLQGLSYMAQEDVTSYIGLSLVL